MEVNIVEYATEILPTVIKDMALIKKCEVLKREISGLEDWIVNKDSDHDEAGGQEEEWS
jgi:hypothetical protein